MEVRLMVSRNWKGRGERMGVGSKRNFGDGTALYLTVVVVTPSIHKIKLHMPENTDTHTSTCKTGKN